MDLFDNLPDREEDDLFSDLPDAVSSLAETFSPGRYTSLSPTIHKPVRQLLAEEMGTAEPMSVRLARERGTLGKLPVRQVDEPEPVVSTAAQKTKGFAKGAARAFTAGIAYPENELPREERGGAVAGDIVGTFLASAGLALASGPAAPAALGGYALLREGSRLKAQGLDMTQPENIAKAGISGVTEAALLPLPGALGAGRATRAISGAGIGASSAAAETVVSKLTNGERIDVNDPDVLTSALLGLAAGAGFGVAFRNRPEVAQEVKKRVTPQQWREINKALDASPPDAPSPRANEDALFSELPDDVPISAQPPSQSQAPRLPDAAKPYVFDMGPEKAGSPSSTPATIDRMPPGRPSAEGRGASIEETIQIEPSAPVKKGRTVSLEVNGEQRLFELTPEQEPLWGEAEKRYQDRRAVIQRNFQDNQERGKALKGAGMEYAAERRRIVGALTPKEDAALSARQRSNYTGKSVDVDVNGHAVPGKVVSNPYGRVKVELESGEVVTVEAGKVTPRQISAQEPQRGPRMADPSQVMPEARTEAPAPSQPARGDIFDQAAPAPVEMPVPFPQSRLNGKTPAAEAPKAEATGPREIPRDNFLKRLSQYAPRLYRETNIDRAMEFIPHGSETMTDWGSYHFAEVPEMAKGQGTNRGILLEFDAGEIKGRINLDKPGLDFAFQNRQGEFVAAGNSQNVYRQALRGFTVFPDAKGGLSYTHRLRHIGNRIVKEGWTRTKNPDGSLTYTRPPAPASATAAAPAALAPSAKPAQESAAAPRAAEAAPSQTGLDLKGPEMNRALLETLEREFPARPERAPFVTPEAPRTPPPPEPPPPTTLESPSRGKEPPSEAPPAPAGPEIRERSFLKTLEKNDLPGGDNRTYEVKDNAQTVTRANAEIDAAGIEKSIEDVLAEGKPSAEHTAKGILLIKKLQEAGDRVRATNPQEAELNFAKAVRVAADLSQKLTEQGQAIQAASIVARLSPDGVVLYAQRQLQRQAAERLTGNQRTLFGAADPAPVLTPEAAQTLREAAKKMQEFEGYADESRRIADITEKIRKKEPLSAEDLGALREYQKKIKALVQDPEEGAKTATSKEPRRPGIPGSTAKPKAKSVKGVLLEVLDQKEAAARARLKARGYRLYSGIPLDDLADFAIIGATKIARAGLKYSEWSAGMVKDFGEDLKPHLAKVYRKAREIFIQERARAAKLASTARTIHAAIEKIDTDTSLGEEQAKALGEMVEQIRTLTGDAKLEASWELQSALQALSRPTMGQKVSSIQTMAQLLNPKTTVRNIIGNEMFFRVERLNKYVASPIDWARSKLTGADREVTFRTGDQGEYWSSFLKGAQAAWRGVNPEGIQSKYDLGAPAFRGKYNPLTYLEKTMSVTLKGFDYASYYRAKMQTLGELAELRAINAGIPSKSRKLFVEKFIRDADDRLQQIADDYGKYVTFQDENLVSGWAVGLKKQLNRVGTGDFGLGDFVLKYPKTPANVFMRAVDYSPAGFAKSAIQLSNIFSGRDLPNYREMELGLSRALVGSVGAAGLAYYLADKGVLTGRAEKDRDARAFKREQTGEDNYQVNASALARWVKSRFEDETLKKKEGDVFVSYNWAQPIAISLAAAATANQEISNKKTPLEGAAAVLGAATEAGLETFAEQPFVQSMQNLFGGGPNVGMMDRLGRVVEGIPSSFMPTLFNQISQAANNTKRETYSPTLWERSLNKAVAKLPMVSESLPKMYRTIGADPKEIYQDGTNTLFNVFLNPAFVAKYKVDPMVEMILKPYEGAGLTEQFPQVAKRKLTYTDLEGEKRELELGGDDVSRLQRLMGAQVSRLLSDLDPKVLKPLTYEDQEERLAKVVNRAANAARQEFFIAKGIERKR